MSIRPVDFNGMLQRTDDVSYVKHQADAKPVVDQQNIQVQVDQNADRLQHEVSDLSDSDQTQNDADAREEGHGFYFDSRRKNGEKKKEKTDGKIVKKISGGGFDIKI